MARTTQFEITQGKAGGKSRAFSNKILLVDGAVENVIVIGTQQHSSDWRRGLGSLVGMDPVGYNSKLMFVHQALRKVLLNADQRWNIILCRTGYSEPQQDVIVRRFVEIGCTVTRVSSARHIINYLNNGNGDRDLQTHTDRTDKRVSRLQFYSHGAVGVLGLGMGRVSDTSAYRIAQAEAGQLNREAFAPGAKVYSFACRSGIGNPDVDESVYETNRFGIRTGRQLNLLSRQSIAQYLANGSGSTVYAYLRRSEYSDTLNTADELDFMDYFEARLKDEQPDRPSGRQRYGYLLNKEQPLTDTDQERYTALKQAKDSRTLVDGAMWDPSGARHGVRAAVSPDGVPPEMQTFQPE